MLLEGARVPELAEEPTIALGVNLSALSLKLQLHLHQLDQLIGPVDVAPAAIAP